MPTSKLLNIVVCFRFKKLLGNCFLFFSSAYEVELLDIGAVEDFRIPAEDPEDEKSLGITFSPPLYIQRYNKVVDILSEQRWIHAINRVVGWFG